MDLPSFLSRAKEACGSVLLISQKDITFQYEEHNRTELRALLSSLAVPEGGSIIFCSTYRKDYARTHTLIQQLRSCGYSVRTIIEPKAPLRLLWKLWKRRSEADVYILGFRGHLLLPFVRRIIRKPLIFDVFVSAWDTLCHDRKKFSPTGIVGTFLHWYDGYLCRISDAVLIDTQLHRAFFQEEWGIRPTVIYIGTNKELFPNCDVRPLDDVQRVLWYGSAIAIHGIDRILHLARITPDVTYRLIGPVKGSVPPNVTVLPWSDAETILHEIHRSDVCLGGPFGDSAKAGRVIPLKVYEMLACGAHVLVPDSLSLRELMR